MYRALILVLVAAVHLQLNFLIILCLPEGQLSLYIFMSEGGSCNGFQIFLGIGIELI
jgi:hypothetical protein